MKYFFPASVVLLVLNGIWFLICILAFATQQRHDRSDAKLVLSFVSATAIAHVIYITMILRHLF